MNKHGRVVNRKHSKKRIKRKAKLKAQRAAGTAGKKKK